MCVLKFITLLYLKKKNTVVSVLGYNNNISCHILKNKLLQGCVSSSCFSLPKDAGTYLSQHSCFWTVGHFYKKVQILHEISKNKNQC